MLAEAFEADVWVLGARLKGSDQAQFKRLLPGKIGRQGDRCLDGGKPRIATLFDGFDGDCPPLGDLVCAASGIRVDDGAFGQERD